MMIAKLPSYRFPGNSTMYWVTSARRKLFCVSQGMNTASATFVESVS
jgi:hypothetical protein